MRRVLKWSIALAALAAAAAVLMLSPLGQRLLYPLRYQPLIVENAAQNELDPALVAAVILCESHYDAEALSKAGAVGLMQLMPATALWLCERESLEPSMAQELTDPEVNIRLGCAMLRRMIAQYRDVDTALAAYNAGPGHVDEWLADARYSSDGQTLTEIPYTQTRAYVRKVRAAYEKYETLYAWE